MKIKIFPSFVLILILWACSQNKNSVNLTEDDSVWVLKTKDFLTAKDLRQRRYFRTQSSSVLYNKNFAQKAYHEECRVRNRCYSL